jgi:hypothetical protein
MLASPAWAQKNSAAASFSAPFTGSLPDTITATIEKGKRKRLLVANATAVVGDGVGSSTYCDLSLKLTANGVSMLAAANNRHAVVTCNCADVGCLGCTANAAAYLDLDVAEAANPGLFIKQPINVQLQIEAIGGAGCAGGADDAATLVVQMLKK